ncbi:hypothetical protein DIPPA_34425 [Diplonema papillatum]|nr:hypothetical protein DIPPA_34425 [Diplonema papillatum]
MYLAPYAERRNVAVSLALSLAVINVVAWWLPPEVVNNHVCTLVNWDERETHARVIPVVEQKPRPSGPPDGTGDVSSPTFPITSPHPVELLRSVEMAGDSEDEVRFDFSLSVRALRDATAAAGSDVLVLMRKHDLIRRVTLQVLSSCASPSPIVSCQLDSFIYDFGCREKRSRTAGAIAVAASYLFTHCGAELTVEACFDTLAHSPKEPKSPLQHAGMRAALFSREDIEAEIPPVLVEERAVRDCLRLKCLHPNLRAYAVRVESLPKIYNSASTSLVAVAKNASHPLHEQVLPLFDAPLNASTAAACKKLERKIQNYADRIGGKTARATNLARKPTQRDLEAAVTYARRLQDANVPWLFADSTSTLSTVMLITTLCFLVYALCGKKRRKATGYRAR